MDKNNSPKTIYESTAETVELVLPNDANTLGNILGGKVMHLMDVTAALAARRFCRKPVVTVSVDHLEFLHPIKVGHHIILKASVNRTFRTSMEVGVKVFSENPFTGEQKHTSSAYLTFVALDENGQPTPVPEFIPQTDEQKRRWQQAGERRKLRLQMKKQK